MKLGINTSRDGKFLEKIPYVPPNGLGHEVDFALQLGPALAPRNKTTIFVHSLPETPITEKVDS